MNALSSPQSTSTTPSVLPESAIPSKPSFSSDNTSAVWPEVLRALQEVNETPSAPSYGYCPWSVVLEEKARKVFGPQAEIYPVFTGTGANVLAISAVCQPWEGAVCTTCSHLNEDETGAPEAVAGVKLVALPHVDGKLQPEVVADWLAGHPQDEHRVQPRVLSLTQSTEYGTVYTPEEVQALADLARKHDLLVHMDGARLSNAAVGLGLNLREATLALGVDLLSLGGTKNGLMAGEAVVFLREGLSTGFRYRRKQFMQLASKSRYLASQWLAFLQDDRWAQYAGMANDKAQRLAAGLDELPEVQLRCMPPANAVFATFPQAVLKQLQEEFDFYEWDPRIHEARLMCAWNTPEAWISHFLERGRQLLTPLQEG